MRRAHHADAPERGARPGKTLPDTKDNAPQAQQDQAHQRPVAARCRQQIAQPAEKTAAQPHHHDTFWPQQVGITPGVRATEQSGEVLQTYHQPRPEGAESHNVVDIARQYRQRQANGEITCEVEDNDGDNTQVEAQTAKLPLSVDRRHR